MSSRVLRFRTCGCKLLIHNWSVSRHAARRRGGLPPGVLIERRGSLLFTHFGLSGPAVLDVSRAVTAAKNPRGLLLVADFLPDTNVELKSRLACETPPRRTASDWLPALSPNSCRAGSSNRCSYAPTFPLERRAAELSKAERSRLTDQLKRCEIRVTGSRGFDKAEVTAGGVVLDEIDSRTMESKLVPNLFLAGEILDLDGFIGGYNFQAAFSTGWLAGESV